MNFGEALEHLRAGRGVTREQWDGEQYLVLVPYSRITVSADRPLGKALPDLVGEELQYTAHIDVVNQGETVSPWVPSQTDVLATDWELA